MTNYTPNEQDKRRAEQIRRQYIAKEENTAEKLIKLDSKVKAPGRVVSTIIGIVGALVMGAGMSMIMVRGSIANGLILSIPGLVTTLAAYPIYELITNSRKQKYADEIARLSGDIINK